MAQKDTPPPLPPEQLPAEVDRLFDELIHRPWGFHRATEEEWSPSLDLYETEEAFILEADLPGVNEQEVSVTIEDDTLILQGRRAIEYVLTQGNFYCHERRAGQFVRRLHLPTSVDQERLHAEFHTGVLRVTLPKSRREGTP